MLKNITPFLLAIVIPTAAVSMDKLADETDKIAADHLSLLHNAFDLKSNPHTHQILHPTKNQFTVQNIDKNDWTFYSIFDDNTHRPPNIDADLMGMLGCSPSRNTISITYRFTQQTSHWGKDLREGRSIVNKNEQNYPLHSGFFCLFENSKKSLYQAIGFAFERIPQERKEIMRFICSGHGMGGAVATNAAFELADKFAPGKISLRTFSSPPAMTSKANEWMKMHKINAKAFSLKTDPLVYELKKYSDLSPTGTPIIIPSIRRHDSPPSPHDMGWYQLFIYDKLDIINMWSHFQLDYTPFSIILTEPCKLMCAL